MIDIHLEDLISLRQACEHQAFADSRTGRPCHLSALYRYVTQGARAVDGQRIRLETVKLPKGIATSRQAIQRFIAKLTDPDAVDVEEEGAVHAA